MAHERKCVVCNKEYKYCSKCGQYNANETWRYMTCSENCRDIFDIIPKYNGGYNKDDLKNMIKGLDISVVTNPNVKKIVDDIASEPIVVSEDKPTYFSKKKKNKNFVNDVVEVEPIVEETIPVVEDTVVDSIPDEIIPPVEEL